MGGSRWHSSQDGWQRVEWGRKRDQGHVADLASLLRKAIDQTSRNDKGGESGSRQETAKERKDAWWCSARGTGRRNATLLKRR
eukprot:14413953-Alexandrium_andersonii.AAC.1